jgi:HK97 gp10 family phage protein
MEGFIEIDGFEDLEELIQGMNITEEDQTKAMRKAIKPIAEEVEKNTPSATEKLKKSIKVVVKKEDLAVVGIVRLNRFYDFMQEFGTSQQKHHVGFFDRSVRRSQDEAISILSEALLK